MGSIHRASPMRPFSWEVIQIGDEYGPVVGTITDFQIKSHAYAVDDYGDWYLRDSPFGGRIGHPTLLAEDILRLVYLGYDRTQPGSPVGFHTHNEMEFLRPVRLGQEVTIRGKNVDKFQKRGQNNRVIEGEVLDSAGEVLVRMRAVERVGGLKLVPKEEQGTTPLPKEAITGCVPEDAPMVDRATRSLTVGAVLPSLTKPTSLEQSMIYSGFFYGWVEGGAKEMHRDFHTDPEGARSRGLPDSLVQALVSNAYLSELCTGFFGPSWLTTGRLSAIFIRPVIVRDTITVSGIVKRGVEDGDHLRLELDVWCKNQRGELTTVGRASAVVQ